MARDHHHEIVVSLEEMQPPHRKLEVVFRAFDDWADRLNTFAIITAYPTTGETWPQDGIDAADQSLAWDERRQPDKVAGFDERLHVE